MNLRGLALLAGALGFASAAGAAEVWSHEEISLSLSGSISEYALYTHATSSSDFSDAVVADLAAGNTTCVVASQFANCPAFEVVNQQSVGQSLTRFRLRADLQVGKAWSAVVVYDNETLAGILDTLRSDSFSGFERDSFLGAEGILLEGDHVEWRQRLYRGYVRYQHGAAEVSIGRQRIAWGVGRLWNPIDRFSALPPLTLEPNVVPGIDGIDARWNLDGFSYLQFVYSPGSRRDEQRWAARVHGVVADTDLSLLGGVFEDAPTVGMDLARNLGDGAVRLEAVYTDPEHEVWKIGDPAPGPLSDYWQVDVSADINLDVGTGLYLLVEYLYNGNALGFGRGRAGTLLPLFEATDVAPVGLPPVVPGPYVTPGSAELFGSSRVVTSARHQMGFQMGYDLTPELRLDVISLVDFDGGSAVFFPLLAYTPLGSLELTFGVQLFAGPRLSQYGSQDELVYLRAQWFH
ncbi:hypothetical protein MK489_13135 [Myxococcota bacterium]|nr:hypothetical protein [Myxococcota bacterium]